MYEVGVGLLIGGAIVTFASDKLFKRGKIKDVKSLLKVKLAGLGITIIGMIIMMKIF